MKTIFKSLLIVYAFALFQSSFGQNMHKSIANKHHSISINFQGKNVDVSKGFWSIERDVYGIVLQLANSINTQSSFKRDSFFISFYLSDRELSVINNSSNGFNIVREAGMLTCKRNSERDNEQGTFAFNINKEFTSFLKKEGVKDGSDYDFLKLFLGNVDSNYVLGIKNQGYQPSMKQLSKMGILGLDLDYVSSISETNYKGLELNMLIKFFIHGIEKQYIEELTTLGYGNIDANMIKSFAIHDISSNYIKGLQDVGYADLDASMIKKYAIHSVSVDYIRGLNELGYKNLDPNTIKSGVSLNYIKSLNDLNINKPSTSEIKKASIHDVTANFVKRAIKKGYNENDLSYYVKLKIHGI